MSTDPVSTHVKFALVTTGGTIAGLKTDAFHYQSAELKGQALADRLGLGGSGVGSDLPSDVGSDSRTDITWEVHSPYAIGSQNLTWNEMFTLRELLIQLNADATVHGVLVTHGTDTMEDMLFFLSLTLPELSKPIVFTGSMLTSDSAHSDAQNNVADSVRLLVAASSIAARGVDGQRVPMKDVPKLFGLVMNGKFTPASQVQKRSTSGVDAFENLSVKSATHSINNLIPYLNQGGSFSGLVSSSQKPIDVKITLPNYTAAQLNEQLQQFTLEVVYCTPNLREGSIKARIESLSPNGSNPSSNYSHITLIIAAPGNGNIPSRFIPELKALMLQGVRVVRASRISQSQLGKGGELTGLEDFTQPLVLNDSHGASQGAAQSAAPESMEPNTAVGSKHYHEAHGLSLNQVVVMETCRFLMINS
ncbi:MAG: asparaginase domain-containing protein [Limnobacter sp.]|nr:asparaginase domain-containing protein [Limnobacter sp.]